MKQNCIQGKVPATLNLSAKNTGKTSILSFHNKSFERSSFTIYLQMLSKTKLKNWDLTKYGKERKAKHFWKKIDVSSENSLIVTLT